MVDLDEPALTSHYVGFGNHSFTARCPGYNLHFRITAVDLRSAEAVGPGIEGGAPHPPMLKAIATAKWLVFSLRIGCVLVPERACGETMSYRDLIRRIADCRLDGLDGTVYWFADTSPEYLASRRKAAFKNGVPIYNVGVRVQLSQPTPELQLAEFENIRKRVDVADRLGASHVRVSAATYPKVRLSSRRSHGRLRS
jgi:hypothetical protein